MEDNENSKNKDIDWSSIYRKEDWLVVWMGFAILFLSALGVITELPNIGSWSYNIFDAIKLNDLFLLFLLGISILVLTSIAVTLKGESLTRYWFGFPAIFLLAILAFIISKQSIINITGYHTFYGLSFLD